MKPVIQLYESVGLGLIIEYPSGIIYSNQTGGTSCLHPEVEGVFVPLRNDIEAKEPRLFSPGNDLFRCFEGPKHNGTNDIEAKEPRLFSPGNDLFRCFEGPKHNGTGAVSGLDRADADFIEGVLQKYSLGDIVTVDRDRLRDSHEAWVHVVVNREEEHDSIFRGLGPYPRPGVLTWTNTD